MADLLRIEANERIDAQDFRYLADEGFSASEREPFDNFFTDPTSAKRSWILGGFNIANPVGKQVRVDRGTAILAQRVGGQTLHGALLTKGDPSKTIDIATFAPGVYGVYIRFEYVDSDVQSRIFWNPSGLGSELARSIATRRKANWSLRIEASNPGDEWLKIATVDQATMAITDLRDFYFEGPISTGFAQTWGAPADRDPDRANNGITDLQTFTQAVRKSIEEQKGGTKRWFDAGFEEQTWEKGVNVGFATPLAAVQDRVRLGDLNSYWENDGVTPKLVFDDPAEDGIQYDRASDVMSLRAAGSAQLEVVGGGGSRLPSAVAGLDIALGASTPVARSVRVGDANFVVDGNNGNHKRLRWDAGDYIEYDRVDDELRFFLASTQRQRFDETGIHTVGGVSVGTANSSTIADDEIEIGDLNFRLKYNAGNPILQFDGASDHMQYIRASNRLDWSIASLVRMALDAGDLRLQNNVDLIVESGGLAIGNFTPTAGRLQVGDTNFFMALATDAFLYFDSNDYLQFDRSANQLGWYIAGSRRAYLDGTGLVTNRLAAGAPASTTFSSPDPGGFGSISVKSSGSGPAYFAFQETDLGTIGTAPEQYWRMRGDGGDLVWDVNTHTLSLFLTATEILRLTPAGGLSVSGLSTTGAASVGTALTAANANITGGANFAFTSSAYISNGIKVGDDDFRFIRATAGSDVLPTIVWDSAASDFLRYDRTNNQLTMFIGGNEMFQFKPNTNAADVFFYLGDPADKVYFETKTNQYGYNSCTWHVYDDGTYHDYVQLYKSGGTDLTWRFVEANGVKWIMQAGVFRPSSTNYVLGSSTYEFASIYGRHYASNLSTTPTIGFHSERKSVYCGSISVTDLPWLGTRAHHNQGTTNYTIGVSGDDTSTALSWLMWFTTSTPTNNIQGMTITRMFRFQWTGDAYGNSWQTTGADLAEVFPRYRPGVEPGDLIALDRTDDDLLVRSSGQCDGQLLGVFSTKPGLVLGGSTKERNAREGLPLALIGRVPIKVTDEGGPIRPGDPLTAASRPGYAMKATRPGRIVGRALVGFDDSHGQIEAFVNCQDWVPPEDFVALQYEVRALRAELNELRGEA